MSEPVQDQLEALPEAGTGFDWSTLDWDRIFAEEERAGQMIYLDLDDFDD